MLTPCDMKHFEINKTDLDKLEDAIDASVKSNHGNYPYECAILHNEYPLSVRDAISKRYKLAGWNYVYHITSSENGERPGLTEFIFSIEKLSETYIKNYHQV